MSKLASKLTGLKSRQRIERKRHRGICVTPHCRNRARDQRTKCNSCRSREYYERHPLRRLFNNLKTHAKARGKQFLLDFESFAKSAAQVGYDLLHGCKEQSLTVDRIDHRRGYEPDNIQFLSHSDNSRKGWYERHGKPWEMPAGGQRSPFSVTP